MAVGAAAVTVAATGYQIYAANKAAKEEAEAYRQQAESQRKTAKDVMERYAYNAEVLKLEAKKFAGSQTAAVAGAGIAIGSGAHLDLLADTERELNMQLLADRRDAEASARAVLRGASLSESAGNKTLKAGKMQAWGAAFSGASKINYSGLGEAYANSDSSKDKK